MMATASITEAAVWIKQDIVVTATCGGSTCGYAINGHKKAPLPLYFAEVVKQ